MDRYYVDLLDEPVPMLGNIAPRRAAKSPKSRKKLVAWLKLLENGAARHGGGTPMAGYDFRWMGRTPLGPSSPLIGSVFGRLLANQPAIRAVLASLLPD